MFWYFYLPLVSFFLLTEIGLTVGTECCKVGNNEYELCDSYCCKNGWLYDECCYSSYRQVSYNEADMSDCDGWWAAHVWAAVLIGLGSLGTFVAIIVCCICCIKGCAASDRRTGAIVVNHGQPATGMIVLSNANAHHQQQQPYGGQMLPGQAAYPPGYSGSTGYPGSGAYPGPSGIAHPPPYSGTATEKSGEPVY